LGVLGCGKVLDDARAAVGVGKVAERIPVVIECGLVVVNAAIAGDPIGMLEKV
jgi:hypothetical protein